MRRPWCLVLAAASLVQACTAIPAPSVLDDIDRVRESPSAKGAERDAPAAFAVAEKLRADARAAFDAEDTSGAQLLGERAIAAYEEAVALARVVRADKGREQASAELEKKEARLAQLDTEHQKVAADIAAVEARLKVLRNLELASPSGPAGPAREKARWQAVGSLHLGARLLCSAADLLAAAGKAEGKTVAPEVAEGKKALSELEALLADKPKAAPIDAAMRARSACLESLTRVRRGHADPKKATGSGDALLEALSKLGHGKPSRDDRGVVVTLRGVFDANELSPSGKKSIDAIAAVGKKHARFPVMVVVHDSQPLGPQERQRDQARGAQVVAALRAQLGTGQVVKAHIAGNLSPLVDPKGSNAQHNARIDVVFVSPENL